MYECVHTYVCGERKDVKDREAQNIILRVYVCVCTDQKYCVFVSSWQKKSLAYFHWKTNNLFMQMIERTREFVQDPMEIKKKKDKAIQEENESVQV